MAILIKSGTLAEEKNRWGTTWECFHDAVQLNGKPFSIDIAAEPETRKVNRFMVSPDWMRRAKRSKKGLALIKGDNYEIVAIDALKNDWDENWWCNPPFDLKAEFLQQVAIQREKGRYGMMLLPYEPLTDWWRDLVSPIAECVYQPNGRYNFYKIDGVTKKTGVNFGSVFVRFSDVTHKNGIVPRIPFIKKSYSRSKNIRPKQVEKLKELYVG